MITTAAAFRLAAAVISTAVVGLAPFPLASNRDWAWSPLAAAVGVSLVAYGISRVVSSEQRKPALSPTLLVSAATMATVLAWALVQTLTWDGSSRLMTFFASAHSALGIAPADRNVVDTERALTGIMRLATYAGVFWLATQIGHDRRYARAICLAIVGSAVLITLYGWAMEVSAKSCIALTFVKRDHALGPCPFSGTFVNSSNYADFASLASLICLANLHGFVLQAGSPGGSNRARWRARLMALTGTGAFYLTALFFLLGSVVYSASRAGLISFVVAAFAMTMLMTVQYRERRGSLIGATIGVTLLVAITFSIGGEGVLRRSLAMLTDQRSDRLDLFSLTATAISLRPWAGWGPGSFEALYAVFQPTSLYLTYNKAHNTYLENALDLGVPASLLLIVAITAPALRCVTGLRERSRDVQFSAAAIGATILIAVHSVVDFGIQIPAVAVAYSALLGVGWAQSWSSRHSFG